MPILRLEDPYYRVSPLMYVFSYLCIWLWIPGSSFFNFYYSYISRTFSKADLDSFKNYRQCVEQIQFNQIYLNVHFRCVYGEQQNNPFFCLFLILSKMYCTPTIYFSNFFNGFLFSAQFILFTTVNVIENISAQRKFFSLADFLFVLISRQSLLTVQY